MSYKLIFYTLVLLANLNVILGQELQQHQWKNRLLLLLENEDGSAKIKRQLSKFKNLSTDLNERQIMIYVISPTSLSLLKPNLDQKYVKDSKELWIRFKDDYPQYQTILIGLDGSVKFKSPLPIGPKVIFNKIDTMPMRKQEIREKNNLP